MKAKPELIIIDTNLWLSFLISKSFSNLDKILKKGRAKLVFSEELLKEFVDVASRPKFEKYITSKDITDLMLSIRTYAEFFDVNVVEQICRDPKDDFLIALAKSSKAQYLLTGDEDLLILKNIDRTKVVTITDYFSKHSNVS